MNTEFDYKNFRLSRLNNKRYRHLYLLLYWLLYGFFFFFLEGFDRSHFTDVTLPFDRLIPFCEYFVIFYFLWFAYMAYVIIYVFFFDIERFKLFSYFSIITYTVAVAVYFIFPSVQSLRPEQFARDNIFVSAVKILYSIDTPTNVCPSIHVIGSFAALFTIYNAKGHTAPRVRVLFVFLAVMIILSTMFIKQHAVIDVISGIIISLVAYFIVFYKKERMIKNEKQ